MAHGKLRTNHERHLNDNLGPKQEVNDGLWVLVDKPYYCDSLRYKFDTSSVCQEND